MGTRGLEGVAEVDDAGAVGLGSGRLDQGRTLGHDDGNVDTRLAGGKGDALGVVPRAGRDEPAGALPFREGVDGVERTANLEGARTLELFALEHHWNAHDPFKRVRGPDGRLVDAASDRLASRLDVVDGDMRMRVHGLLQIVRRSQQWGQTMAISAG